MNSLVFLVAFSALAAYTSAQDAYICDPAQVPANTWVVNGYFARRRDNCMLIHHCVNGAPVDKGSCNAAANEYFSLSLGTCAHQNSAILRHYFNAGNCDEETRKYDIAFKDRRERICQRFMEMPGRSPTRIYAGDYEDCQQYFNCRVNTDQDWKHVCPGGTFFDDTTGDCSMRAETLDRTRCAPRVI